MWEHDVIHKTEVHNILMLSRKPSFITTSWLYMCMPMLFRCHVSSGGFGAICRLLVTIRFRCFPALRDAEWPVMLLKIVGPLTYCNSRLGTYRRISWVKGAWSGHVTRLVLDVSRTIVRCAVVRTTEIHEISAAENVEPLTSYMSSYITSGVWN